MKGFVAVHVGAGYHSEDRRPAYKKTCRNACRSAIKLLNENCTAIEAVTAAVSVLEDSPFTNAGIGSNLTIEGKVECDAGIMDGKTLNFGSVGALVNIKNPIQVVKKILEVQNNGLLSCGRIPPSTLVGEGALKWALENGFISVNDSLLTTKTSRGSYLKNISLLNSVKSKPENFEPELLHTSLDENHLQDTVGGVCVDKFGNVASAVSSGGLLLKYSGRIGQATVYGAGCWAQNSTISEKPSIACSATGVGEYLIKTLFAKECFNILYEDDSIHALNKIFENSFLNSPYLKNRSLKLAGLLAVKHFAQEDYCELSWAHTTKSMILGHMSTMDKNPYSVVSVLPPGGGVAGAEVRR